MALTPKKQTFVTEYLKTGKDGHFNATAAAIASGYSAKTARSAACRLLKDVDIAEAISKAAHRQEDKILITKVRVLEELARLATSDISAAFDENGLLKPIKDIPEDVRRAISGVEVEELFDMEDGEKVWKGYTKKVKFWDKNKALENLGRYLKMFTDKLEVKVDGVLADRLKAARERAK